MSAETMKTETVSYFYQHVDPLFNQLIFSLLIEQPINPFLFLAEYFELRKNGLESRPKPLENRSNIPREDHQVYFKRIAPIINDLIKKVARNKPIDLFAFLQQEIKCYQHSNENIMPTSAELFYRESSMLRTSLSKLKLEKAKMLASEINDKSLNEVFPLPTTPPPVSARVRQKLNDAIQLEKTTSSMKNNSANSSSSSKKLVSFEPLVLQIAVFGLSGSGKSSIVNILQKIKDIPKPTIGFRPVTLFYDENKIKIHLFDLGGGEKIRNIWKEYFHDIYGFVFAIDSRSDRSEIVCSLEKYRDITNHCFMKDKPNIIICTKCDEISNNTNNINNNQENEVNDENKTKEKNFMTSEEIKKIMIEMGIDVNKVIIIFSCCSSPNVDDIDVNIEKNVELLVDNIKSNYKSLNKKVENDSKIKLKEETIKRIEKEKNVLKMKTALVFHREIEKNLLYNVINKINPNEKPVESDGEVKKEIPRLEFSEKEIDAFDESEGISFLKNEINESSLPDEALVICKLIGYQRLSLQIVAALKSPINKKKIPLEWSEILNIILELREQLGLNNNY